MAATITLTSLNITGYYLGRDLQGSNSVERDIIDTLALQITAKLMVGELVFVLCTGTRSLTVTSRSYL